MHINTKSNIREYSYEILLGVLYDGKLLNESINKCFNENELSDKDKSYIKSECAGLIEKCNEIDSIITRHLTNKNNKLDKELQMVLRIGVYELLFFDKVPAFATIDECVKIVKHTKLKALSGFVNAVLRSIHRNILSNAREKNDCADSLKRCYFRIYNNKVQDVINELDKKNVLYKSYDGALDFKYAKVYYTNNYKSILDTDSFKNGYIVISDASSIYLTDRIAGFIKTRKFKTPISNDEKMINILDVCAAPGGKILGLMDLIRHDFNAIYAEARDISDYKINKIRDNVDRLKVLDLNLIVKDASLFDRFDEEKYDVVICDVPCTGLGVVNKKPDIIYHYSDVKLKSLTPLQKAILNTSSKYVKSNGILSYSTCTTTYEENEAVVKDFLDNNKGFSKLFEKRIEVNDENKSDGFYMCILEKIDV